MRPGLRIYEWPYDLLVLGDMMRDLNMFLWDDRHELYHTLNGHILSSHVMELVRGQRVDPAVVNTIGDMINCSGVRRHVLSSLEAALLHIHGVWPPGHHSALDAYDALLFPLYTLAEGGLSYILAVASIVTATVYYLAPDDQEEWSHNSNVVEWMQHLEWRQTSPRFTPRRRWDMERWPTQQTGAGQDRAIGTMLFMLNIARGEGLPHPSFNIGPQCAPYPTT